MTNGIEDSFKAKVNVEIPKRTLTDTNHYLGSKEIDSWRANEGLPGKNEISSTSSDHLCSSMAFVGRYRHGSDDELFPLPRRIWVPSDKVAHRESNRAHCWSRHAADVSPSALPLHASQYR